MPEADPPLAGLKSLGNLVLSRVRTIMGVTKTITCCCVQ